MDNHAIAVIDLSNCRTDKAQRKAIASQWNDALKRLGVVIVTGHGIPHDLIESLRRQARQFFEWPIEKKMAYHKNVGFRAGGYKKIGTQTGGKAHQIANNLKISPTDLIESFFFWKEDREHIPKIMSVELNKYFDAMHDCMNLLLTITGDALGLQDDMLKKYFKSKASLLRLAYYPNQEECPPLEGQIRFGAHKDLSALTVLYQDPDIGGLEVQDSHGNWIPVPYIENSYVINVGDFMEMWTNGKWKSPLHRVVNPPPSLKMYSRLSLAFFMQPDLESELKPFKECVVATGGIPLYPPVITQDYTKSILEKRFTEKF